MASPAFGSQTTVTLGTRTNITFAAPSGLANDDIMVAWIGVVGTLTSVPAGWTLIPGLPFIDGTVRFYAYWKRAASESGSYTWNHTSTDSLGWLARYTGCITSGNPIDDFSLNTGTSTTITALSIDTTVDETKLVYLSARTASETLLTPPTGMTERHDSHCYTADQDFASAGSTGNRTQTVVSQNWGAILLALKPITSVLNITGALYTDTDTFFASVVTRGIVTIDGALYTDADTFFASSIVSTYSITGALYTDSDTFFGSTLTTSITITGALYTDTDTFFASSITAPSHQTITGALYTDADTFFASSVFQAQTISGALYTDADVFNSATFSTSYAISGTLYTDADTFFVSTVSTSYSIAGALFSDGDSFFSNTVTVGEIISGSLYVDADTFFTSSVIIDRVITGSLFSDADTFFGSTTTIPENQIIESLFWIDEDSWLINFVYHSLPAPDQTPAPPPEKEFPHNPDEVMFTTEMLDIDWPKVINK